MSFNVQELLAVCGREVSKDAVRFITTGLVLPLLAEQPPSPMRSLGWHADRLNRAVDAGSVGLRFDRFGQLSGFAMWAHVTPSTAENLLRHGAETLPPAAWTAGDVTWLLHLASFRGGLTDLLEQLRDGWLSTVKQVTYFKYKRGRRIAKRVDRADRTSFFQRRGGSGSVDASFLRSHEADGLRHAAAAMLDAALELGEIVLLARQCPELADLPLPLALHRLHAPLILSQRRLYRRADGSLCGAITWGWLDAAAPCSAPGDPHLWPLYQWNAGTRLTLCDAIALDEGRAALLQDLETDILANEPVWLRPPSGSTAGMAGHHLTPGSRHDAEATAAHGADLMPRLQHAVRELA